MKAFEYTFNTTVEFSGPVREHAFVLRCQPRRGEGVTVLRDDLAVEPGSHIARQHDSFGNVLAVGSAREPHGRIAYRSSGKVRIDLPEGGGVPCAQAHPLFRYPSPLAPDDAAIRRWAHEAGFDAGAFAGASEGDAAAAIAAFEELGRAVHDYMAYEPGSTSVTTRADEAFAARRGVCQDFAHIMVVALRQAGVSARYVGGLAIGQGTTHAWAQAHLGGAWHGFDPTRNQRVDEGYLPLAVGRDWSDCPIERGSFWGLVDQTQTVFMTMQECDPA